MSIRSLSLRQFTTLMAIHTEGSYRGAADLLDYSPGAIAQQVSTLERELGVDLFTRPGGPKAGQLTIAGAAVLDAAEAIMRIADRLALSLAELKAGEWGRLAIGTFHVASAQFLPQALASTFRDEPQTQVSIFESDDNDELIHSLLAGELDATFLIGPIIHKELDLFEVARDPYLAVMPATASQPESISLSELGSQSFIGHNDCACHVVANLGLRQAGVEPHYVFRSNDNTAIQAMVRAGVGMAIMPSLSMNREDPGVHFAEISPPLPDRQILLAIPKNNPAHTARRFLARIREITE